MNPNTSGETIHFSAAAELRVAASFWVEEFLRREASALISRVNGVSQYDGCEGENRNHPQIEMLHDLLLDWCSDHNLNPNGADAHEVAQELADLFDTGVRDQATLREAIASR